MRSILERFEENYTPEPNSGCWLWTASTNKAGYGGLKINGKTKLAHRISWELENGPIPDSDSYHGVCVCHSCDNPACVNPSHLFIGSHKDNMRDMYSKGRRTDAKGERQHLAKLNETSVKQIRKYYAAGGCSLKWLSNVYRVHLGTIHQVVTNKTWRHV